VSDLPEKSRNYLNLCVKHSSILLKKCLSSPKKKIKQFKENTINYTPILDKYYKETKRINEKYNNMEEKLKMEHTSQIINLLRKPNSFTTQNKIDEIIDDYEITRNLLNFQKIIEEEENVKKTKIME